MHDFHAEGARGRDVVGVVVDEHRFVRRDAHARAGELVDRPFGLAHPDVARVDDLVAHLDRKRRAPVLAEFLHVVGEQADAQAAVLQLAHLVDDHPVHTRCRAAPEPSVRVHVERPAEHRGRLLDHAFEVRRDVDRTLLEQVPVGFVTRAPRGLDRVRVGGDRIGDLVGHFRGDGASLDADVVRLAEEQFEQGTLREAFGLLERADADEERARDDAAVVEDDGADHAEKLLSRNAAGPPRRGSSQITPVITSTIAIPAMTIRYQPNSSSPCRLRYPTSQRTATTAETKATTNPMSGFSKP